MKEDVNICFISDGQSSETLLDTYRKMTPRREGRWYNIVGVTEKEKADFFVVIDHTSQDIDPKKCIHLGAHPSCINTYKSFDKEYKEAAAVLEPNKTFGFGEWWLDADYDTLSDLEPLKKRKNLCAIVSNNNTQICHEWRLQFIELLCEQDPSSIDLYGRVMPMNHGMRMAHKGELGVGRRYWQGKDNVLGNYKHSIEIDVGPCKHYFSERVFDSLLVWCMPIYWGCTNLEDYLPPDSFVNFDIHATDEKTLQSIIDFSKQDFHRKALAGIAEARYLLLNKYQLWARVKGVIDKL